MLVHFNHKTGHIDDYIEFNSYLSNIRSENNNLKIDNSYKFANFILTNLKDKHKELIDEETNKFKDCIDYITNDNNNEILTKHSLHFVNISTIILNNSILKTNSKTEDILNITKLFKKSQNYLDILSSSLKIKFFFFDFNDKNNGLLLKDFLYVYRNKHNHKVKFENIINNFNNLVDSRLNRLNNILILEKKYLKEYKE